jgi:defect-in-organelle-trafficking protein DotD
MKKRLLLLLPFSILLVACSSTPKTVKLDLNYVTKDSVPVEAIDKTSQVNMAESSTSISHSLQELAAITQASHPDLRMPDTYNAGELHMTERTSISWTGPVEPLLQKIAKAAHYQLVTVGAEPVIPVLVAVDKRDKPLADIFHDIRYQIIDKAQILVYPSKNIIELRYMQN